MSEDDYLFLAAPEIEQKYTKLIKIGWLFIFIGLGCVGLIFAYLYSKGTYDEGQKSLSQMLPVMLFIIPGYGIMLARQAFQGQRMYYRAAMNGIVLDREGIKGPIAFLEGPLRDHLRDQLKQAVFQVEWARMEQFIVEPRRGKRGDAPPYYKIPLKGGDGTMHSAYFILRDYFKGRENQVIDYVRKYLDKEQIVLNDELVNEEGEKNE